MKKELELKLEQDFPYLFKDLYGDKTKTCIGRGIECGDGWEPIIRRVCFWLDLYHSDSSIAQSIYFTQIKEKFGKLRIYINQNYKIVHELIFFYESISIFVCDVCGQPGELKYGNLVRTRCDLHKDWTWKEIENGNL
ncbi:MAG: hypothetical protein AABY22_36320 [Nanoarchaeota archaeon]